MLFGVDEAIAEAGTQETAVNWVSAAIEKAAGMSDMSLCKEPDFLISLPMKHVVYFLTASFDAKRNRGSAPQCEIIKALMLSTAVGNPSRLVQYRTFKSISHTILRDIRIIPILSGSACLHWPLPYAISLEKPAVAVSRATGK